MCAHLTLLCAFSDTCAFSQWAPDVKVAHEAACEVQLRFVETVRGIVANNVLARGVTLRDSATVTTNSNNLLNLGVTFQNKFMDPANGDFRLATGTEADAQIIGKGKRV